jgi:protein-tyrosine phosphatase
VADESSARDGHRVLFVCYANICRSPLAEGLFRHLTARRGLAGSISIDSAGTHAREGSTPHPSSIDVGREQGFAVQGQARQLLRTDLARFDEIVLMDRHNLETLERLLGRPWPFDGFRARVRLLRQIADPQAEGSALDVPDPIGGDTEQYRSAYELIYRGCVALLDELE